MKILFLRHEMLNIGGTGVFTNLLIQKLHSDSHIVGLWPSNNMVYEDLKNIGIKLYPAAINHIDCDWDIIIIQHSNTFMSCVGIIEKVKNTPIVFISHSSSVIDQVEPRKNVSKVFKIAENVCNYEWEFPDEFVEIHRNPVEIKKQRIKKLRGRKIKLLVVSRLDPDRAKVLRKIIILVNKVKRIELTIIGDGVAKGKLISIANENVKFIGPLLDTDKYYRESDIIIGSGRTAIESLAMKRPFIVFGARGYGGLVTPDNYEKFKANMFSGRIDDNINEPADGYEFIKDIKNVFDNPVLKEIIQKNYRLVKRDYDVCAVTEKMINSFNKIIKLEKEVRDDKLIRFYKPRIVSNIEIKADLRSGKYELIRKRSGKVCAKISKEMIRIIELFDGNKTINKIIQQMNIKDEEVINILIANTRKLWMAKIIYLEK